MASSAQECINELRQLLMPLRKEMNLGFIATLEKTINGMSNDIGRAERNEYVGSHPELIKDVIRVLHGLTKDLFVRELTEVKAKFCMLYRELVINWNKLANNEQILEELEVMYTALNSTSSMREMIHTMRRLIDEANQLINRTPPIYQVSRHYLKTLEEALSKREQERKAKGDGTSANCQS